MIQASLIPTYQVLPIPTLPPRIDVVKYLPYHLETMHLKKLFSIIQEKLLLLNDSMACCKMVQRNKFEMMWHHIVTSYVLLSKISDVTKQDWAEPVEQKNLLNWRASKQFG